MRYETKIQVIRLEDLEPNPCRNLKKYPINRKRLEKLKGSINSTDFWGGLTCRKHPTKKGKYQLAIGHHRYIAVKELGWKELEIGKHINIFDYVEYQMYLAFADDNRNYMQHEADTQINTVEEIRDFLNKKLRAYSTWEELVAKEKFFFCLYPNSLPLDVYRRIQTTGVGKEPILDFLSIDKENGQKWKIDEIGFGLRILRDKDKIDEKAVTMFENKYQSEQFVDASKGIPKEEQKDLAKKVIKELDKRKEEKEKGIPSGGRAIKQVVKDIQKPKKKRSSNFQKAETAIENIEKLSKKLLANIVTLQSLLTKMKVTEISGINIAGAEIALDTLIENFKILRTKQLTTNKKEKQNVKNTKIQ